MKHAGEQALDRLEPLIAELRTLRGMIEKKRGVFYRKSKAFLHFHEDPAGLFADLRTAEGVEFERYDVSLPAARQALIAIVAARLKA